MTEQKFVRLEKDENIAVITVDHPPANALTMSIMADISKKFNEIADDGDIKVVIITGAGDKIFIGGTDLKSFTDIMKNNSTAAVKLSIEGHVMANTIAGFPKPVIAALNGMTMGGGCELALSCDIRIASAKIKIGLPEVTLGLLPGGGGTQRLPRLVGYPKAMELLLTGAIIDTTEALRIGLINTVAENSDETLAMAKKMAKKIATYPSETLYLIKQLVYQGQDLSLTEGIKMEQEYFGRVTKTPGAKEGVTAFLEKRKPNYDGL